MASQLGQDRVQRELQRRRLPGALDSDIEEAVTSEALRFLKNGGSIESVPGWCNARIAARVIDLARGVIRRERAEQAAFESAEDGTGDNLDEVLTEGRYAVLVSRADPLDVCGALTVISVLAENAVPDAACPQPVAGATPEDAACWVGLWYAGREDCFGEGNTVTQRRVRAARRVKKILREAVTGGRA